MIKPQEFQQHARLLDMLRELGLFHMADRLAEEFLEPEDSCSQDTLLFSLLEEECRRRRVSKERRLRRQANLPYPDADLADPCCLPARNLDPSALDHFRSGDWICGHDNVIITGEPGTGKTYLACAIANAALSCGFSARLVRVPVLMRELAQIPDADITAGVNPALLNRDLLILSDFSMIDPHADPEPLFQFIEAVSPRTSLAVLSSIPISNWRFLFGERTSYAAAVASRLHERSHLIELKASTTQVRIPNLWDACILPF